jgi:hypothetical protein
VTELFDDLTPETLEWAGDLIAFDDAEIRAKANEVINLEGDGLLAVRYDEQRFDVSFVVFSFAGGPVTAGDVVVDGKKWERVFSGSGPAGTLRELRHTSWGEPDAPGYIHCPSGVVIADAFKMLRRWFDC